MSHEPGDRPFFPPEVVVQVKALACELPVQSGRPLSRFSRQDLVREVTRRGIAAEISGATIWRWLDQDAIRPWQHRSWIFPRDPQFEEKAGRVLDLYQGCWQDEALGSDEYVISADEKTSIQARLRTHRTEAPAPGPANACALSLITSGAGPWCIWLPGTSGAPKSLAAVPQRPELLLSIAWSNSS